MNNTYRTDFENMRVPTLQTIYTGITHKRTQLQQKLAADMGRTQYYDILPRNFTILPIERCSIHDLGILEELHEKAFDCYWEMERKKAEEKGDFAVEEFEATFKFYSFMDCLTDTEQNRIYEKAEAYCNHRMSSQEIIRNIMQTPDFLEVII